MSVRQKVSQIYSHIPQSNIPPTWYCRDFLSSLSMCSFAIAATKASRKIFPIDHPTMATPLSFGKLHCLMIWSTRVARFRPCSMRNLFRSAVEPDVMMRLSSAVYGVVPGYPRLLIQIMRAFLVFAWGERRWKVPFIMVRRLIRSVTNGRTTMTSMSMYNDKRPIIRWVWCATICIEKLENVCKVNSRHCGSRKPRLRVQFIGMPTCEEVRY